MSYQFKITLEGTKPTVWRRLRVPNDFTFGDLHVAIQVAMGWTDSHLYSFNKPGSSEFIGYVDSLDGEDADFEDAEEIGISEVFEKVQDAMIYIYDFGDNWEHMVVLEEIVNDNLAMPYCITGESACPPEDCGGIFGYQELLKILKNPKSKEYKSMREWLSLEEDEYWDPKHFDVAETNKALEMVFNGY
jgi:hypothetical protein